MPTSIDSALSKVSGTPGRKSSSIPLKVTGPLSANHGEVVHQWCLDGRGVLLRSYWDVRDSLASGALVHVLPDYQQPADIWAVHAAPLSSSAKIRVAVEFLRQYFAERYAEA